MLNGAAATATGLALIGGLFSNLRWNSAEGTLAAFSFLVLLGMSGSEVWNATALSRQRGLRPRSALLLLVLVLACLLYVVRLLTGSVA